MADSGRLWVMGFRRECKGFVEEVQGEGLGLRA